MNNFHDSDYLSEFFKNLLPKHEIRKHPLFDSIPSPEQLLNSGYLVAIVNTSPPKKSTNELLDDYIDLITLYELFGDEGYKSKSEYILGLLKEKEIE